MPNPYCVQCGTFMECAENSVTIPYPVNRTVTGDKYRCPKCSREVVVDFGEPEYHGGKKP